jgi:hypothetical protein
MNLIRKNRNNQESEMKTLTVVILVAVLAACSSLPPFTGAKGLSVNPYIVDINWNTTDTCKVASLTEDTTTCVPPAPGLCVGRSDFIIWRSNNPSDAQFEIFFDPLFGPRLKSGRDGWVVRPIDDNAPIGDYKYSIVRKGCPPNKDNTFDPHIRIRD